MGGVLCLAQGESLSLIRVIKPFKSGLPLPLFVDFVQH